MPGFREWVLVALVVVAFYGRTAQVRSGRFAGLSRWLGLRSVQKRSAAFNWLVDRWWVVFMVSVSLAIVAWLAMSMIVVQRSAGR